LELLENRMKIINGNNKILDLVTMKGKNTDLMMISPLKINRYMLFQLFYRKYMSYFSIFLISQIRLIKFNKECLVLLNIFISIEKNAHLLIFAFSLIIVHIF
jgi:hypothetical protein